MGMGVVVDNDFPMFVLIKSSWLGWLRGVSLRHGVKFESQDR